MEVLLGHVKKPQFTMVTEKYSRYGSNALKYWPFTGQCSVVNVRGQGLSWTGIEAHPN